MKTIEKLYDNLYLGKWEDCIVKIPNNSIDLIVTSPPYNVDLGNNKYKKDKYDTYDDNMPYDKYLKWMEELFTECNRVLKKGGRLCVNIADGANGAVPTHADFTHILLNLFGKDKPLEQQELADYDNMPYDHYNMMTTIVWDKYQMGSSTAWGSWKSPSQPSFPTQFEFIIVVGKGTTKHQGSGKASVSGENFIRNSRALWQFPPESRMIKEYGHPSMFPEELPRRCIDQLTYIGDVVLDPFSGAGTTCTVAKKMGRHYIGFEVSEKYHKKAENRLSLIAERDEKTNFPKWI